MWGLFDYQPPHIGSLGGATWSPAVIFGGFDLQRCRVPLAAPVHSSIFQSPEQSCRGAGETLIRSFRDSTPAPILGIQLPQSCVVCGFLRSSWLGSPAVTFGGCDLQRCRVPLAAPVHSSIPQSPEQSCRGAGETLMRSFRDSTPAPILGIRLPQSCVVCGFLRS